MEFGVIPIERDSYDEGVVETFCCFSNFHLSQTTILTSFFFFFVTFLFLQLNVLCDPASFEVFQDCPDLVDFS